MFMIQQGKYFHSNDVCHFLRLQLGHFHYINHKSANFTHIYELATND